ELHRPAGRSDRPGPGRRARRAVRHRATPAGLGGGGAIRAETGAARARQRRLRRGRDGPVDGRDGRLLAARAAGPAAGGDRRSVEDRALAVHPHAHRALALPQRDPRARRRLTLRSSPRPTPGLSIPERWTGPRTRACTWFPAAAAGPAARGRRSGPARGPDTASMHRRRAPLT